MECDTTCAHMLALLGRNNAVQCVLEECEAAMEDENVDDCLLANEYEFHADGTLA